MPEHYTPGYSSNATDFMAMRTVENHASFFKPYLQPGMQLLDCGCGPGTITLGLAKLIAPGTVIGIDQEVHQIKLANHTAAQQNITNAAFQVSSIYDLPFGDRTFDAVFSHALFEHLQHPITALQELQRVLKPGGVIGLRSPDWGGFLITPGHADLKAAISYYKHLQQRNGGNPYVGRELHVLLRQAGFTQIKASAAYECYEPLCLIGDYLALRIESSKTVDQAIAKGWTDAKSLERMSRALREWSQHPDGLFAQSWCEVVGFKTIHSCIHSD
ncbi:MAG TPA: methyltransferase domain-containing protein [Crinalium sp.]|jgi:ubiquinone/menaquinone biosynthesis C-methylase UbiE